MQSIKFNDSFYLVIEDLQKNETPVQKLKPQPTNFIFVIDVSGSMSGDLGFIRKQLKNKLPNLIKDGDTITIVWFSGRSDAGILMEEVEIKSLKSLQDINKSIDRFLTPIGATAFHKPLVLAKEAIGRIKKNRDGVFSLIFLTDGCNNDCNWNDVMTSLKNLESDLAASAFVEYGYYADSRAIGQMAELIGGEKIEAQKFDDYDMVFESKIQKTYSSAKKKLVDLPKNRKFDFAFTIGDDNEIILYSIQNNQVLVPENTKSLMFFSEKEITASTKYNSTTDPTLNKLMYGSVYVLSEKLQNDYVDDIFKTLGDQRLYKVFTNAYGKQKLMNFKSLVKECVTDISKQFLEGRSTNIVADENAYCVMDFVNDLANDDNALVYPMHEEFDYNRIGAKKVAKTTEQLNEEVKDKIAKAKTKDEIQEILNDVDDVVGDLKFEFADKTKGYNIDGLVWSSERANLSMRIRFDGFVNLPANKFGLTRFETFIYRTYTIIKDGILNLSKLPVSISHTTYNKLLAGGVKITNDMNSSTTNPIVVVDFSLLPVINKRMVKSISAKQLALLEYELLQSKALEKVYKYYDAQLFPRTSKGIVEKYGTEAEGWLKALGITEFNGFAPSMTTEKSTDFYMAVELNTKIALHSALPSVESVLKKNGKGLKPVEELMQVAINDYNNTINSSLYTSLKDENLKKGVLENWLKGVKTTANIRRKQLLQEIAKIKFALILSKKWFQEFATFEEHTLKVQVGNNKSVDFDFDLTETEVKL